MNRAVFTLLNVTGSMTDILYIHCRIIAYSLTLVQQAARRTETHTLQRESVLPNLILLKAKQRNKPKIPIVRVSLCMKNQRYTKRNPTATCHPNRKD